MDHDPSRPPARRPAPEGDPAPTDDDPAARDRDPATLPDQEWARRLHDHTHEVELLISAALVFGLFQAPGALDAWFDGTSPHLVGGTWTSAFVAWYYTKLIVYTLILAFGLHLVARAYWVGLIGLDSVFPDGVDWDRMSYGPGAKEVYRRELVPLSTMARRADRFASAIFSLAFLIVCLFVFSVVLAGVVGLVALGLAALVPGWSEARVWLVLMVTLGAFPMLATALDRWRGDRIDGEGGPGRAIRRILRLFYRLSGGALFLPIQFVLFTRVAKKVIWPLYVGFFVALVTLFLGAELARSGTFTVASSSLVPARPGTRSVDTRYFAGTRDPASTAPFIQAEVLTGPYVRLELPLVARRERDRMEVRCGDLDPLGRSGLVRSSSRDDPADAEATDAVLACLAGLWTVRLDGEPLEVAWDFRSEPGTGVTGLVAYLPTDGMAPGPHLLEIEEVPVESGEDEEGPRRHLIRFRT